MPEKKKTIKRKSTTFCQSKPSKLVRTVAVYIKEQGVWVACKGKLLQNYLCKYFYNGKVGIVDGNSYRWWGECYNDDQMQEMIRIMNLDTLEDKRPKRKVVVEQTTPANTNIFDDLTFLDDIAEPVYYDGTPIRFRAPAADNHITEIVNGNP